MGSVRVRLTAAWRRGLFLLIGGLVAIPYAGILLWALTLLFSPMPGEGRGAALARAGLVLIAAILVVPAFLTITRTLERTAANQLLDLDVPDLWHPPRPADRLRGAVFFAGHLVSGGLVVLLLAFVLPTAVAFAVDAVSGSRVIASVLPWLDPGLGAVLTIAALLAGTGLVLVAGALLPWYARMLLGPSADEQLSIARAEAAELGRRNEIARELHDTIGHALTLTTIQAAAARRMLERDPEGVREALAQIERAGRAAANDLDRALGVLRAPAAPRLVADRAQAIAVAAPQRTLEQLGLLLAETRAAGLDVSASVDGDARSLPAGISAQLYRIAQEALTNALRYASSPTADLSLAIGRDRVTLDVVNPAPPEESSGGRGVSGMRERVALLGGRCRIGRRDGDWVVSVTIHREGL